MEYFINIINQRVIDIQRIRNHTLAKKGAEYYAYCYYYEYLYQQIHYYNILSVFVNLPMMKRITYEAKIISYKNQLYLQAVSFETIVEVD